MISHSCSLFFSLTPYHSFNRYIAVDGTSLTVCEVNRIEGWFTFMLIAYTQKHIIVPHKAVGDRYVFVFVFVFLELTWVCSNE